MADKTIITVPFRPVYPTPAALIASADENKKSNLMTAGEVFNIGLRNPAIIGIALRKATYTHGLISRMKEFTVNLATAAILDKVDLAGTISGRDGLDKFVECGLTPLPSHKVAPPIVAECPVNLECVLLSITEVGDHDLFLGEVVCMHADSDKIGENQRLLIDKLDGFAFAEWEYYAVGRKLGSFGFSRNTGGNL
jgi:flavin reductase (DIM6/NTAB) family NADH-FMN oxidoreductase RutF